MDDSSTSINAPTPVSSWLLLRVWLALSIQSFGGGGATMTLIRRAVVEQYAWITESEFVRDWAICQMAPGINLISMTILIGRRIAGWRGIFLCLTGMLLPSTIVTVLMTAFYAHVRDLTMVKDALRAIIPASVGLGLYTAYDMARPPLKESSRDGKGFVLLGVLILLASGAAMLVLHPPVIVILVVAGLCSAGLSWWNAARVQPAEEMTQP